MLRSCALQCSMHIMNPRLGQLIVVHHAVEILFSQAKTLGLS